MKKNYSNKSKKIIRKIIFTIMLFIIFLILLALTASLYIYTYSAKIQDKVNYNESGVFKYSVCLKQNESTDQCISENRNFNANLVDHINIYLKYYIESSEKIDYIYNYEIIAHTSAFEKGESSKIIYTSDDEIISIRDDKKNTKGITINEQFSLDFEKYSSLINSFKESYLNEFDSNLIITARINITGIKEGINEHIDKKYEMDIIVPLDKENFSIITTDNEISSSSSISQVDNHKSTGYTKVSLASDVLYKIDIAYLAFIVFIVIKNFPKQRKYEKTKNKILKNYDSIIVRTKSLPDIGNSKKIEVESFDDIISAHKMLNKPIIFFENKGQNYSVFTLSKDKESYMYVLYAYEGKKKKKKS